MVDVRHVIAAAQPDYIFHLAGCVAADSLAELYRANVDLAAAILDAVTLEGMDQQTKILFVGSAAEYGYVSGNDLPVAEDFPAAASSHYGISKLAQTKMAMAWSGAGRQVLVVRPFTIMGEGMPAYLAVGSFIEQIAAIQRSGSAGVLKTGNLDTRRDFLCVGDVVWMLWVLINNEDAYGQVVNVCAGVSTRLGDIVDYAIDRSGSTIRVEAVSERIRSRDMADHFGSNRLLNSLLGDMELGSWQSAIDTMLGIQ
jgi:GDP-4-dehydro-6-deoxy-D-mannose reductase